MDSTCVTNPNFNSMLLKHSCILITDHLGIITFASELFCKLSQYECYELIGKKESILYTSGYLKDLYDEQFTTLTGRGNLDGGSQAQSKKITQPYG
ncbi:MAG: PAS domain-containing protein [Bacillaceae bacterium]|nr:PAS domain-containing protein [Bacillaceae bacterium]